MIVCVNSNLEDCPPDGVRPGKTVNCPIYGWRKVGILDSLISYFNFVRFEGFSSQMLDW